jgi:hypothetical protein
MTELYLDTGKNILQEDEPTERQQIKDLFDQNVQLLYQSNEELLVQIEGKVADDTEYFYLRKEVGPTTNYKAIPALLESHLPKIHWDVELDSDFNSTRLGEIEKGQTVTTDIGTLSSGTKYILVSSVEEGVRTFNTIRGRGISLLIVEDAPVASSVVDVNIQIVVQEGAEDTPKEFNPKQTQAPPEKADNNRTPAKTGDYKYDTGSIDQDNTIDGDRTQPSGDADTDDSPPTAGESKTKPRKQTERKDSRPSTKPANQEGQETNGGPEDGESIPERKSQHRDVDSETSETKIQDESREETKQSEQNQATEQSHDPQGDAENERVEPSVENGESVEESASEKQEGEPGLDGDPVGDTPDIEKEESTTEIDSAESSQQGMNSDCGPSKKRTTDTNPGVHEEQPESGRSGGSTDEKPQSSDSGETVSSEDRSSEPLIPSGARFEVFDGPTGEKYFDTDGEPTGANERIKKMFHDDVSLHYDPGKNTVICYFNAQRNAPQQFLARYTAPNRIGDELLRGFKEAVQVWLIEDAGWSFVKNAGVKQVVFEKLLDATPLDPEYSESEFDAINDSSPVHFVTPNVYNALRLFQHLREQTHNNASIAISSSGETAELDSTKFIIQPGFTEADAEPMDGSVTEQKLAKHRLDEIIENGQHTLQEMVRSLPEEIPPSNRQVTLAEAINAQSLEDEEIVVADENADRRLRALSDFVTMTVAVGVAILGLAYFIFNGAIERAISELGSQLEISIPGSSLLPSTISNFSISAQASTVVGGMVALTLLGVMIVGARNIPFKQLVRHFQLGLPYSSRNTDAIAEEGNSLGETLVDGQEKYELAKHPEESPNAYQDLIDTRLFKPVEGVNLGLKTESGVKSDKRRHLAVGAIIGIVVGLGFTLAVYAILYSISTYTLILATASVYLIVIYLLGILGGLVYLVQRKVRTSIRDSQPEEESESSTDTDSPEGNG